MENKSIIYLYLKNLVSRESIYENTGLEFIKFIKNNFNNNNDIELILNYMYDIMNKQYLDLQKYIAIRLLRDLIYENLKDYKNLLLNHKIIDFLFNYLLTEYINIFSNKIYENKSKIKFLLLFFKELDSKYGIDEYGKDTKFKKYYIDLKEKGIDFNKIVKLNIYLKSSLIENNQKIYKYKKQIIKEYKISNKKQYKKAFTLNYFELKDSLLNEFDNIKTFDFIEKENLENKINELKHWLKFYSKEIFLKKLFKNQNKIKLKIEKENIFIKNLIQNFTNLKNKEIDFNKFNKEIKEEKYEENKELFKEEVTHEIYYIKKNENKEIKVDNNNFRLLQSKIELLESQNSKLNNLLSKQNNEFKEIKNKNINLIRNIDSLKNEIEKERNSRFISTTKINVEKNNSFNINENNYYKENEFDFNLNEDDEKINIIENTTVKGLGKKIKNIRKTVKAESLVDQSIKNISSLIKKNSFEYKNLEKEESNINIEQKSMENKIYLSKIEAVSMRSNKVNRSRVIINFNKNKILNTPKNHITNALPTKVNLKNKKDPNKFPIKLKIKNKKFDNGKLSFIIKVKNLNEIKDIKGFKIEEIKSNSFVDNINIKKLNIDEIKIKDKEKIECEMKFFKFPQKSIYIHFSYCFENETIYDKFEFLNPLNEFLIFEEKNLNNNYKYNIKNEFKLNRNKIPNNNKILYIFKNINLVKCDSKNIFNGNFTFNKNKYYLWFEIVNIDTKLEFEYNDIDDLYFKEIYEYILDILK